MAIKRAINASTTAALCLAVAACGSSERAKVEGAPNLALACQTMECTCSAETGSLFGRAKTTPALWRANGDTYCPEGFVLEPVEKNP